MNGTLPLSNTGHTLHILVDERFYEVTAVCLTPDEANRICAKDESVAVIDTDTNGITYVAKKISWN